jgi:peptidoglycan/LPS O-acetylase OafA/YrhL
VTLAKGASTYWRHTLVLLLEVLRGLAALWVFLFHAKSLFAESSPLIYHLSEYGHLGVPMFFVISGYVISFSAESTLTNKRSPFVFIKNRFLRIYPTFWASIAVVCLTPFLIEMVSYLKTGSMVWPANPIYKLTSFEWGGVFTLANIFFSETDDLQSQFSVINAVYWTIAIEFQFYLMVFISLFFRGNYKISIGVITVFCWLLLFFPSSLNYGLFVHFWPSFSVGILLAYVHKANIYFRIRLVYFLIAIAFVAFALLIQKYTNNDSFTFALLFGLGLWLISGAEKVLVNIKLGGNKYVNVLLEAFLILGAMSYSVYLLHGKIYMLPNQFVRQIFSLDSLLNGWLTVLGTLVLCFPFYFFIERKFLSKNYKKIHQKVLTGGSD